MRLRRPDFMDSPYAKPDPVRGRLFYVVADDAPEDAREDLRKQVARWNKSIETQDERRRKGIIC